MKILKGNADCSTQVQIPCLVNISREGHVSAGNGEPLARATDWTLWIHTVEFIVFVGAVVDSVTNLIGVQTHSVSLTPVVARTDYVFSSGCLVSPIRTVFFSVTKQVRRDIETRVAFKQKLCFVLGYGVYPRHAQVVVVQTHHSRHGDGWHRFLLDLRAAGEPGADVYAHTAAALAKDTASGAARTAVLVTPVEAVWHAVTTRVRIVDNLVIVTQQS